MKKIISIILIILLNLTCFAEKYYRYSSTEYWYTMNFTGMCIEYDDGTEENFKREEVSDIIHLFYELGEYDTTKCYYFDCTIEEIIRINNEKICEYGNLFAYITTLASSGNLKRKVFCYIDKENFIKNTIYEGCYVRMYGHFDNKLYWNSDTILIPCFNVDCIKYNEEIIYKNNNKNTTENNTTTIVEPTATIEPVATVEPTITQKVETEVYVSSGGIYHRKCNCSEIKEYTIMTLTEAQNRNYKKCRKCWYKR